MRFWSLLILGSVAIASPALADCTDQRLVFQPSNGKRGFRVEIVPAESGSERRALVYRPFHATPDTYEVVEQPAGSGARLVLIGPAGALRFDLGADGTAVADANRDIPSRWRLACN